MLLEAVGLAGAHPLAVAHIIVATMGNRRVRRFCNQRRSDSIKQHRLAIELELERLPLVDDLVDSLAQVTRFEVRASDGAGVLLTRVIISVDTLVIVEVDIIDIVVDLNLISTFMLHG